jgi:hypothetical protein
MMVCSTYSTRSASKKRAPKPGLCPSLWKTVARLLLTAFLTSSLLMVLSLQTANAEPYQGRLGQLLIQANEVYLPSRLVVGQDATFTIKAPAGSVAKVFLSPASSGYVLNNKLPLQVGDNPETLSGTVPASGVLQLKFTTPNNPELDGKSLYVDAVIGSTEQALNAATLIQANGHKTQQNQLAIVVPAKKNGPAVLPSMPGVSPQLFNQITNVVDTYSKGDEDAKNMLDKGDINRDRPADQNPFINRGLTPGIGGGSR